MQKAAQGMIEVGQNTPIKVTKYVPVFFDTHVIHL
jgi:hypothetical protein